MVTFIAYLIYILSYKPFFLIDNANYIFLPLSLPSRNHLFYLHVFLLGLSIMMLHPMVEMCIGLFNQQLCSLQDIVIAIGEGM